MDTADTGTRTKTVEGVDAQDGAHILCFRILNSARSGRFKDGMVKVQGSEHLVGDGPLDALGSAVLQPNRPRPNGDSSAT